MLNRQIYVFTACVESGSFAKAAEKLYLSPPAVMKQINELEKKLGVTLLERTSRGVVPTAAGAADDTSFSSVVVLMRQRNVPLAWLTSILRKLEQQRP